MSGNWRPTLGDSIIAEIVKQGMVNVDGADEPVVFVWKSNCADQLNATVAGHVRSCTHSKTIRTYDGTLWCARCGAIKGNSTEYNWLLPEIFE